MQFKTKTRGKYLQGIRLLAMDINPMKIFLHCAVVLCLMSALCAASTCSAADKSAPKVTLDYPARSVNYFQPFRGTVSDSGGSGVAKVIVRITRIDERKRRWQWGGYSWWLGRPAMDFRNDYWLVEAEIKGNRWIYKRVPNRYVVNSMGVPASGPTLHSGLYLIKVIAYDRANNSRALLRRVRVNADVSAPRVTIDNPRSGQKSRTFPTVKGHVYERGGSGIDRITVTIFTLFQGKYTQMKRVWIGDQWSELLADQPLNDVLTAEVRGNRWWLNPAPASKNLRPGRYAIIVHAYDRAGNRSGLTGFLEQRISSDNNKIVVEDSYGSHDSTKPIYITIQ